MCVCRTGESAGAQSVCTLNVSPLAVASAADDDGFASAGETDDDDGALPSAVDDDDDGDGALADGGALFERAIMESGACTGPWRPNTMEGGEAVTDWCVGAQSR